VTAALHNVSRRDLLKAGTGLVVAIAYAPISALAQGTEAPAHLPGSLDHNRLLSAWLRVDPNGTVTVFTGKVELGQGIGSALAQVAADELDVDYRRINMVTADTSRTPDEGFTAGSQSIEQSGTARGGGGQTWRRGGRSHGRRWIDRGTRRQAHDVLGRHHGRHAAARGNSPL